MLARTIIESDPFMGMPAESQMLYVHLNLAADDDGFVANPRTIMRMCGASDDSMKLLIAKKFVLSFQKGDDFIYLIKHWKIHNTIQKDRYKASNFRDLLREVYLDENKAYSMNSGPGKKPALPSSSDTGSIHDVSSVDTECIQAVSEPETQNRLDKNRLEEISLEEGEDRKGESEGETQMDLLSADERKEKIKFWKARIDFMRSQNFDAGGMYNLAKAKDGITMEEIDSYKEENNDG